MFKMPDVKGMYESMANSSLQLRRGMVWCHECGRSQKVDSAECLRKGWPMCHGTTMSLEPPAKRKVKP